jgi:hypothetical protein
MVKFIQALLLFFVFGFISVSAQQITVKAVTDSTKYKVGDYINYKLDFTYDKNIKINYPSVKDSVKNLDFIKEELPVKHESSSKVMETRSYIFSKYDSSIVTIPAYKIAYTDGKNQNFVLVNAITLTIATVPVDTSKDIQDVKPPVEIPFNWALFFIIVSIVAVLGLTGYLIYRHYQKKKEPKKVIVKIPPYEMALKELSLLNEKQLWQNGKVKEYHSEITEIIRKYFEARFGFQALEMTTGEVLKSLELCAGETAVKDLTERFLNNADLVKFAKFVPIPTVNSEMMEQAVNIVNTTKPAPAEPQKKEGENV